MDETGNNPRNLTNSPKADNSPSWSPNKQQIVFARSSQAQGGILNKKIPHLQKLKKISQTFLYMIKIILKRLKIGRDKLSRK